MWHGEVLCFFAGMLPKGVSYFLNVAAAVRFGVRGISLLNCSRLDALAMASLDAPDVCRQMDAAILPLEFAACLA